MGSAAGVVSGEMRSPATQRSLLREARTLLDTRNDGPGSTEEAAPRAPATAEATDADRGAEKLPSHAQATAEPTCLVLKKTVVIDGTPQKAYGMICARNDGVWRLVPY
jgi:hypothetical protein